MKNKKEFEELIKRYESITLEEIINVTTEGINSRYYESIHDLKASNLTGFGGPETCSLCIAIQDDCRDCFYSDGGNDKHGIYCTESSNRKTFKGIMFAKSDKELLQAFKDRAKHMKTLLK